MARPRVSYQQLFLDSLDGLGKTAMATGGMIANNRRAENADTRAAEAHTADMKVRDIENKKLTRDFDSLMKQDALESALGTATKAKSAAQAGTPTEGGKAIDFQQVKGANRDFRDADANLWNKLNPSNPVTPEQLAAKKADERDKAETLGALEVEDKTFSMGEKKTQAQREAEAHTDKLKTSAVDRGYTTAQTEKAKNAGSGAPKPTEGQKAFDREFAKKNVAFMTGGFADANKNLSQLKEIQTNLESGEGEYTGPITGRTPDFVKVLTNPKAIDTKEQVEEVVQRNLREILGPQFTEKEGERLIRRAYNDNLDEKVNAKRLGRLVDQISQAYQAKIDAAQYFNENGTMAGFDVARLATSINDFNPDADRKTQPKQAAIAPAGSANISQEDQDAIDWAKANPNDKRSADILRMHGAR